MMDNKKQIKSQSVIKACEKALISNDLSSFDDFKQILIQTKAYNRVWKIKFKRPSSVCLDESDYRLLKEYL